MIDLYDIGDGRRVQRQVTLERCRERIALLERQWRGSQVGVHEKDLRPAKAGVERRETTPTAHDQRRRGHEDE